MSELKKLSLKEEINKEGERIEKELLNSEASEGMEVSKEMEAALFDKIQEYENEKKAKGKTVRYRKKKKHLIFALAAALVLVCGSAMVSTGSKSYWKVLWNDVNEDGNTTKLNVKDMELKETNDIDIVEMYKDILDGLGIIPVRWGYTPNDMYIKNYMVDAEQKKAYIFYYYRGEIIRYAIYVNDEDSSFGQKELDRLLDSYEIVEKGCTYFIGEYEVEQGENNRYIISFEHGGVHYQIKGAVEEGEMLKIIKNLLPFEE